MKKFFSHPVYFSGFLFIGAFFLSYLFTKIVLVLCKRHQWFPPVNPTRWAKTPRPILGGIGMYLSFSAALYLFLLLFFYLGGFSLMENQRYYLTEEGRFLIALGGGSTFIFLAGLFDDLRPTPPLVKLILQLIPACLALGMGFRLNLLGTPLIDIPLGIFWFVGITNAFNLLDNMDGLSAGIAGLSALLLFFFSLGLWSPIVSASLAALSGAALGFLILNFNPAKIFMGDSGSQFLGFTLALLALGGHHLNDFSILAPILVLVVPIVDTSLVTFLRWIHGRGVFKGGTDHLSHRLVALGLSERKAVLILYLITTILGGILLFSKWIDQTTAWLLAGLSLVGILYFIFFLSEVKVYSPNKMIYKGLKGTFRSYGFQTLLVFLDVILISVAFVSSYLIRFEGEIPLLFFHRIFTALPFFIALKIGAFLLMGIYQMVPQNLQFEHLKKITLASFLGSLFSVLLATMAWRFIHYSRAVFIIDWALTVIFITASRSLLRIYREFFHYTPPADSLGIMGTRESIEVLLAELEPETPKNLTLYLLEGTGEAPAPIGEIPVEGSWEDWREKEISISSLLLLRRGMDKEKEEKIRKECTEKNIELIKLSQFFEKQKNL